MELILNIIIIVLLVITNILIIVKNRKTNVFTKNDLKEVQKTIDESLHHNNERIDDKINYLNTLIEEKFKSIEKVIELKLNSFEKNFQNLKTDFDKTNNILNTSLTTMLKENQDSSEKIKEKLDKEIKEFSNVTNESLKNLSTILNEQINKIREDNNKKLSEINDSVNDKLEKTLEGKLKDSFSSVIQQIGDVNKGIGEIKGLANEIGSLKNVLANAKTKGIFGEAILGNIISDILTINQYDKNVLIKKNSNERVEFAIKMPSKIDNSYIYLPVDSKLPLESYYKIKDGSEKNDLSLIEEGKKELKIAVKKYAKEIKEKYIEVPLTTDFAIMFLPIEGLYLEVLNLNIFEEIQKEYKVTIAGPTTFTSILNSLQMGFKTLLIQKKSADVFNLLGAVKTEFEKFASTLEKTQKKFDEASNELDQLVGTRTRKIQNKLKSIESLDDNTANEILEINN